LSRAHTPSRHDFSTVSGFVLFAIFVLLVPASRAVGYSGGMRRLCAAIVVIGLLAIIGLRALSIGERAVSLEHTDYGEGPLAAFVARWIDHSPGRAWLQVPVTVTAYGPLMLAAWRTAAGVFPDSNLLLVGRSVAVAAAAILIFVVAAVVFREQHSALSSAAAVAVLLGSPVALDWFPYARVDTMAAALTCLAYATFDSRRHRLILSAALLVLASLAKQTAAIHVVPLAWIAFALEGARGPLRWLTAVLVVAAVGWGITFGLNEHYFLDASVAANLNRFSAWQHIDVAHVWITSTSSVLMLCAAWAALMIDPRRAMADRWWVGFTYAAIAASILSLKEGSWLNYYMDATWLGAIVLGRVAGEALRLRPRQAIAGFAVAVTLALPALILPRYFNGWLARPSAVRAEAVARLAGTGPLLLDGQLVGYLPRHPGLLVNDPFLLRLRDDEGVAPTAEILERLRDRSATVLLSIPLAAHVERRPLARDWPAVVLDAIGADFCLTERLPDLFVYRHRSGQGCLSLSP
jgi:hypothetical protein